MSLEETLSTALKATKISRMAGTEKKGKKSNTQSHFDEKQNEASINEVIKVKEKSSDSSRKQSAKSSTTDTPRDEKTEVIAVYKDDSKTIEGVKNIKINPKNTSNAVIVTEEGEKQFKGDSTAKNTQEDTAMQSKKESAIKDKGKPIKTTTSSGDPVNKKKKKVVTSKKKVRSVQDQEIPDKKQTSLTDHYQVRRSERKLKSISEDQARLVLQKKILSGIEDGLEIKVIEEKGRGIFATTDFQKGSLVCEYAGELVDFYDAKDREAEYEKTPEVGSYMYFFQYKDNKYCVDATQESNRLGRLLNHSKTKSNVFTKVFPINDVPHLILLASRDIDIGEELLYDYGDRSKNSLDSHPWLKT